MPIQRINFQSIPVADQDRALAFYRDVLGFEVLADAPYEPDWRFILLGVPGEKTRLRFAKTSEMTVTGGPALYLVSDDADADAAAMADKGAEIHSGPDDAPWQPGIRWVMLKDTEGNLILLESLKGDAHG